MSSAKSEKISFRGNFQEKEVECREKVPCQISFEDLLSVLVEDEKSPALSFVSFAALKLELLLQRKRRGRGWNFLLR